MSKKYADIEKQLSKFAEEFQMGAKKAPVKPKPQKVIKPIKPAKQEDSFEKFEANISQSLVNHARKWVDTSKDEKKSKGKYKTFWKVSITAPENNKTEMNQGQPQIIAEQPVKQQEVLISSPTKPLGPYMLFHIQKTSEYKYKKLKAIAQAKSSQKPLELFKQKTSDSVSIYEQWNAMTIQQKDKYYLQYQTRLRKYNVLYEEFQILTDKKKILKPYNRFYRKMYGLLEVEGKYQLAQITKKITEKWATLTPEEKQQYELEYQEQIQQLKQVQKNNCERIKNYREKLAQYQMQEQLYKLEILNKYNLAPKELDDISKLAQDEKILRNFEKKQERQKRKQRNAKDKKLAEQANRKRIIELRQKQILELKLQKYELEGIPRDIFTSTPSKASLQKLNSSTTISKSRKQADSDKDSLQNQISPMNKTKKIKKQAESTMKAPGASSFRKLLLEMKRDEIFEELG